MLAADAMLRSSRFDFRVPWIRRPRGGLGERLGLRRRSTRQEPGTVGEKAGSLRWMTSCFMDPASKGKKMEAESVRGGEDLWDAESAAQQGRFPEHLVVMVNGLVGRLKHALRGPDTAFGSVARARCGRVVPALSVVGGTKGVINLPFVLHPGSECNSSRLTFDGVDLMGDRLAEEVRTVVKQRGGVRKISFVAHSLGGLVARYAIGRLYEPVTSVEFSCGTAEESKGKDICMLGRIAGLEPMNFITFASPHLGSRGHRQLPFLCGLPFLEQRASETAHFIVGRTGKHLFLTDKDDGKLPLLVRMVGDCDDIKFRSNFCIYQLCAVLNDELLMPMQILIHHLLVGDKNYPHIVYVDKGDKINTHNEMPIEAPKDELEEEMIRGLAQVPWERVDSVYSKMQVKSYWLNSDGADVIFHMIDNFLI
ncbi:hypothetical protein ZIOFF_026557 [Zingiber officinale]|uniref:DUF676 domain-containing protein n=1 Tax=Zingiber officinale TaxID=94328 RepID=A0A8J5LFV4_ZINOF|nr:hypothetical protein ZIOFF_026557 [Zingiber officinale]